MDVVRPCLVIEFMTWFERPKIKWKFLHNWKSVGIYIETRVHTHTHTIYIYRLLFLKNIDTTAHLFHKLKFIYTRPTLVRTPPHVVPPPFVIWSHLVSIMFLDFPIIISHPRKWCQYSMNMVWNLHLVGLPGLASYCAQTWAELTTTGWPPFQVKLLWVSSMQNTRPWHVLCTTTI
jgi:hypothetical protein